MSVSAAPWPQWALAGDVWTPRPAVLQKADAEVPGVTTYHLALRDAEASNYRFAPGQFNMLYLPGVGEAAISICGDPRRRRTLLHTVRQAGSVTTALTRLRTGQTLGLRGPFGRGWPLDEVQGQDVVLVAGGIGLPPLRPAIYHLLNHRQRYGTLHLLYGARSPDTLLYRRQYAQWKRRGLNVQLTVDRPAPRWKGTVGVVPRLLERLQDFDPRRTAVFTCGPEVMMRFTAQAAIHRGIAPQRVWISMERRMQCAMGLCGQCQLVGAFLCKDGPVFRYDRIAPWLQIEGL